MNPLADFLLVFAVVVFVLSGAVAIREDEHTAQASPSPATVKLCGLYDQWKITAKGDVQGMDDLCN